MNRPCFNDAFSAFFFGADDKICAFSGAPRPDVINVVLCLQAYHYSFPVRQSVLLSQNGSHPQILSKIQNSHQKREHHFGVLFFASRPGKGYKIKSGCILSKADSILIMGCQNYRLTIKNYRLVT